MSNHVNSLITEIDVSNPPKRKIFVGHIGETGFRKIVFLVGSWKEEFPDGTPTLVYKRADGKTYPVNLNQNTDGNPVFTPSSTETAFAGDCVIQLRWTQDGVLGKTCDLPASVESAIGSVGPLPDDDVRDYEAEISANTNARHTHSNKNILDGITAQKVSMWDEGGNVDKAAIIANTNARHTHNNKNVLDGITAQKVSKWDEGGNIDSELSSASTNPVQNKVVKAALDAKADASALAAKQDALTAGQNVTISGNTISADVDPTEIASNVTNWLDANVAPVGSAVVVDSSLSVEGAAADAKATGAALSEKIDMPSGGQSGQVLLSDGQGGAEWGEAGIPDAVKTALLACFRNVAWISDNGQTYYESLASALDSQDSPISVNYIVVGSPYIDGTWLYPAQSNGGFIKTPEAFSPGSSAWKIRTEIVWNTYPEVTQNQDVVCSVDGSNQPVRSFLWQTNAKRFLTYLSSNGNSWDLMVGGVSDSFDMNTNTTYLLEASYANRTYTLRASTDNGVTWPLTWSKAVNGNILGGNALAFGVIRAAQAFDGRINLAKTKIYIDNTLWWSAIRG